MKSKIFPFLFLFLPINLLAQIYGFEEGVSPAVLMDEATGILSTVSVPYKEGANSLKWTWNTSSILKIDIAVTNGNYRDGVIFWVYNQVPQNNPLRCEYRDTNNKVQYYFDFNLNFTGWRICRIGTKYMQGSKSVRNNLKLHLISPKDVEQGTLYIDRLSFVSDVNYQNAPDAQQPKNTEIAYINHWNALWKWESELRYDIPLRNLSDEEKESLNKVLKGVKERMPQSAQTSKINTAKTLFNNANIRKEGDFLVGAPLTVKDDNITGDIDFSIIGTILYGLGQDAYFNQSESSKQDFLLAWDFALDQGLNWGSSMGNNHHYGYDIREVFLGAFLMREELKATERINDAAAALGYWSGLPETRIEYNQTRDGIVDCWNTLLLARTISAVMVDNESERFRAVESLVRWIDGSLQHAPGNIGGIKPDGCVFHHAGHYPAYAIGGFSGLGNFFACINESDFDISIDSRKNLGDALLAMSIYSNFKDWSTGISGRHPLSGSISQDVVNAFGYLALSGGIYNTDETIDSRLGAEYLRLQTSNADIKEQIINAGITAADTPQGFYIFNHTALGIHRYQKSMISIKGYNSDVWGSEIYTKDNRYGRYQSYGAIEIFNGGNTVSRSESRFAESGWDWNRMPGTTSIHLPWDKLESPQTTTLMARSDEDFAGASSLGNEFGVFGMKLKERNDINNNNYTPDFIAHKSVFVFGNRLVCLGSDINNSNANYPTETTLFQNIIRNTTTEKITLDDKSLTAYSANRHVEEDKIIMLSDILGNYYRLSKSTDLYVKGGLQQSRHNKTKAQTEGNFVTAWINHGKKPENASYEYMIMLNPSTEEIESWKKDPQYEILQQDKKAHIVKDKISKTTGYVCFEETTLSEGKLIKCTRETLVMIQEKELKEVSVSVCDPSLHLPEKVKNSETTIKPGESSTKHLVLKGNWSLKESNEAVNIQYENGNTNIEVVCLLGFPVEFTLETDDDISNNKIPENILLDIYNVDDQVIINGETNTVSVYSIDGRLIHSENDLKKQRILNLKKSQAYLVVAETVSKNSFRKIILL